MERMLNNDVQKQWKTIYFIGGLAALLAFSGTLFDIIFGSMSSSNISALPHTAIERFAEFQQNWFLGLYHLDLLNTLVSIIMIPTFFALFAVHRNKNYAYAGFALILCLFGTTIFVTSNVALPMLELSRKYFSVVDESQRTLLAAAGEALLIRGEHGSLGVFLGFLFSTLSSLCMSIVMLHGKIFSRLLSYAGVIAYSLLLIYIFLVTFIPQTKDIAVMMAAPGGLLALAWILMVGIKLIKMRTASEI